MDLKSMRQRREETGLSFHELRRNDARDFVIQMIDDLPDIENRDLDLKKVLRAIVALCS